MNIFLHLLKSRRLLVGGLCLCAAASSMAVTLGPNTRSAVLGQPLDLSMQMMLEAGDNPQALCLDADVFYADRPLAKNSVQVTPEKSGNAHDWLVHIRAAAPVEGPVVTVHLRAGCQQKTSRRYVVLAAASPRAVAPVPQNALAATGTPSLPAPDAQPAPAPESGADKVQSLEAELRQLRADLQRNQAALAESRAQQQGGRYDKVLVYGLAALLFIAIVGVLFISYLRTISREAPSTSVSGPEGLGPDPGPSTLMPAFGTSRAGDLDTGESLFDGLKRASRSPAPESVPSLPPRDRPRFSVSVPFVPRTVKVPELFDLQQQVDFFSSLGQQAKAIGLLRKHLVDNVKTSALVYLDLLDLYHQVGNEQDYEDLRDDFNRVFNTRIAPFAHYVPAPAGGSTYGAVLLRIQGVWPTRQVFKVIEEALFREPGDAAEVLALEEYRELLLLYAVVRELIELDSGYTASGDTQWPELAMQPRSSPRLGLDIDLSKLADGANLPAGSGTRTRTSSTGRDAGREAERAGTASSLAELLHAARLRESERAGAASVSAPLSRPPDSSKPTGLDSLVDFDDYDTGYRPDDFDKSRS
ncbi:hypothetical protein [Polaromonas sp.]|uniref:hypothetical protein n=1 Tax=Polaromonas sp. TaxID=1869339 RepID=UPI003CC31FFD